MAEQILSRGKGEGSHRIEATSNGLDQEGTLQQFGQVDLEGRPRPYLAVDFHPACGSLDAAVDRSQPRDPWPGRKPRGSQESGLGSGPGEPASVFDFRFRIP